MVAEKRTSNTPKKNKNILYKLQSCHNLQQIFKYISYNILSERDFSNSYTWLSFGRNRLATGEQLNTTGTIQKDVHKFPTIIYTTETTSCVDALAYVNFCRTRLCTSFGKYFHKIRTKTATQLKRKPQNQLDCTTLEPTYMSSISSTSCIVLDITLAARLNC